MLVPDRWEAGMREFDEERDGYDGGWDELRDSGEFGEWLIDEDCADPELSGSEYYDVLLGENEDQDDDWELEEPDLISASATGAFATPALVLPPGALRFGPPPSPRVDTPADPDIWHLTHVLNFKSMCEVGALAPPARCRIAVRPGLQSLVAKRARRPTEWGPVVGACVPFYFTCATPFSYRVLAPDWIAELTDSNGTRPIRTQPSHYVFLRSTVRRVVAEGAPDWMVTNGNAASTATQGWRSLHHLHCVDWSAVTSPWSPGNQTARQAELLVDRDVDLDAIVTVHAAADDAADLVRSFAGPWANRVIVDPASFARARGR